MFKDTLLWVLELTLGLILFVVSSQMFKALLLVGAFPVLYYVAFYKPQRDRRRKEAEILRREMDYFFAKWNKEATGEQHRDAEILHRDISPKRLLDRPSAILASTGTLDVSMMGARAELISGLVVAVAVQLAR